jgi:histone-lysine N-methyltransferase SETD3
LAIFLLEEAIKGPNSPWHHYIDILPKDHSSFPINYTNEELLELIGTSLLLQIHEKVFDLKRDYDRVIASCQKF